jgi:hypothetical protein
MFTLLINLLNNKFSKELKEFQQTDFLVSRFFAFKLRLFDQQ